MMTLEEIRAATINPAVAKEAYDQAAKRLGDALDTRKTYEQKAYTLFNGYMTASLALLGVGGAIFKEQGVNHLVLPFWVAGMMFVLGAILFVLSLSDRDYGAIASEPSMWLNKGTIDGGEDVLPLMLAYITYYHQERINVSMANNLRKARLIRSGIILAIIAPFVLFAIFMIPADRLDTALKTLFH
jgi:hypothetical protein